jgi:hypothetical protein
MVADSCSGDVSREQSTVRTANWGSDFLNLQQPPTVWIGSKIAVDVQICSNTVISCSIPPGLGRNLPIKVTPSARFFPGKPIAGRIETASHRRAAETGLEMQACVEIAGETTTMSTGFSYDGKSTKHLVQSASRQLSNKSDRTVGSGLRLEADFQSLSAI